MRASLFSPAKKATVIVPGFYANRSTSQKQTPGGGGKPVKAQKPPEKQTSLAAPLHKVSLGPSFVFNADAILVEDSRDCEDFPLGFEGQQPEKGSFAKQLKEIDDELSRFDDMEGIDTNQEVLPFKKSCFANILDFSNTHVLALPKISTNRSFFPTKKGTKLAENSLKDITNQKGAPSQVIHPFGTKQICITRPDLGSIEDVGILMGNKRFQHQFLDHCGLPKKTKLVS